MNRFLFAFVKTLEWLTEGAHSFKLLQHYKSNKLIEDPKLETNNLTPVPLQCLLVKYQVCDGAASWFKGERCGVLNFITG